MRSTNNHTIIRAAAMTMLILRLHCLLLYLQYFEPAMASAMKDTERQSPWTSLGTASFSPSRSPSAAMPIAMMISLHQQQQQQQLSLSLSLSLPSIDPAFEVRQDVLFPTETARPTTTAGPTITSHPSISAQPVSPTISPQPTRTPTELPAVAFTSPPIIAPNSDAPTSINPTSNLPPSTLSPSSNSPISSDAPITASPISGAPTVAPTTASPTTDNPTTNIPSISIRPTTVPSSIPTMSSIPSTSPTMNPTISLQPTAVYFPSYTPSISIQPTTSVPTTIRPTTALPSTSIPTIDDSNVRQYNISSSITFYYSTCNGGYCRKGGSISNVAQQSFIETTQNVILLESLLIIGNDGKGLIVHVDLIDNDEDEVDDVGQQQQLTPDDLILRRQQQLETDNSPTTTTTVPYTVILPFNVIIEFMSQRSDWDANYMVSTGFILPMDQESYIQSLKDDTNDDGTFTNIERMSMIVDGTLITTTTTDGGGGGSNSTNPLPDINNNNNNQLYYIIAGTVGGSLLILIIGIIFYRAGRDSRDKEDIQQQQQQQNQQQQQQQQQQFPISDIVRPVPINQHDRVPSEAFDIIAQQRQSNTHNVGWNNNNNINNNTGFGDILSGTDDDDISTLGEPYLGPMMNSPKSNSITNNRNNNNNNNTMEVDDEIGEQSIISAGQEMYVYGTRSRLNTRDDGTMKSSSKKSILFGDDATLENAYANNPYMKNGDMGGDGDGGDGSAIKNYIRIVVNAPRGALGIVIDNVTGDLPILHAIRETSVLHSLVFVGDLLLSVDEVDCRGLTAVQVSRLISGRSENSCRKLTLLRPSPQ